MKDLEPRRQIEFTYRAQLFKATVGTASAEVCFRFNAALKSFAVETACLPELWCEDAGAKTGVWRIQMFLFLTTCNSVLFRSGDR